MEPHHFHHHHQQGQLQLPYAAAQLHPQQFQQQQQPQPPLQIHDSDQLPQQQHAGLAVGGDRLPQWSADETRELLSIRAQMDRSFMETKRNKPLWQAISERMRGQGFDRTPDQCKCKWKNLVTRYKGSESMEAETSRQSTFPYQADMRRIFTQRMETLLSVEAEAPPAARKIEEEDEDLGLAPPEDADSGLAAHEQYLTITWPPEGFDQGGAPTSQGPAAASTSSAAASRVRQDHDEPGTSKRPRKRTAEGPAAAAPGRTRLRRRGDAGGAEEVRRALREFLGWQMRAEEHRMRAAELEEAQRRKADREWRRAMEAMAVERAEMDRQWRKRQEERQAREDERAERRHQLIVALLNKLNATPSSSLPSELDR